MKINLSPQRRDDTLTVTKQSDVLTINGTEYDFTDLPDGGTLPADAVDSDFVIGSVNRVNGELELTLLLPHSADASEAARFPEPIIDPVDGEVELPK
jgi:histidinol phosphatase-like PHP family hydrolase